MNSNLFSLFINRKPSVCTKKIKFHTKSEAIKNRKTLIARRGDAGRKARVFYCTCCNAYHVGKPLKNTVYEEIDDTQEEQFVKESSANSNPPSASSIEETPISNDGAE